MGAIGAMGAGTFTFLSGWKDQAENIQALNCFCIVKKTFTSIILDRNAKTDVSECIYIGMTRYQYFIYP